MSRECPGVQGVRGGGCPRYPGEGPGGRVPAPGVLEDRVPKPGCSLSARQVLCHGLAGAEQLKSDAHSVVRVLLGFPAVPSPQGDVPSLLLRAGGGICCWVALAEAHAAAFSPVSSQVRCQHVFSAKPPARRQAH